MALAAVDILLHYCMLYADVLLSVPCVHNFQLLSVTYVFCLTSCCDCFFWKQKDVRMLVWWRPVLYCMHIHSMMIMQKGNHGLVKVTSASHLQR